MAENQITIELGKTVEVTLGSNTITLKSNSVNALRTYIDAGTKLYLNGVEGDTYLWYNDTTSQVELWVNGARKARWS